MAIKIKKKDRSPEPEDSPAEEGEAKPQLTPDADAFTRASWETASWVEENRTKVAGGIVVLLVAIFGGYFGLQFLESQKVEASSSLTGAFDAYATMVKGSPELEAITTNPDIEAPEETFESVQQKWQKMYDEASASLQKHPQGEVAQAARLSKAAAAIKLGKYDEAIELYEKYRAESKDSTMKVAVLEGLATAYAATEKWDEAVEALEELAGLDEQYATAARYQKARIYERAGKKKEAKELYHEILDAEPDHPNKTDIERRLANM